MWGDWGETRHLGVSVARREDARLLTGRGAFVADLASPGCLTVRFVRSAVPHGVLRGVDTADALASPGVVAVLTGTDLADTLPVMAPSKADGGVYEDQLLELLGPGCFVRHENRPPIATDRVRHVGEIVAAVIARDPYLAEDAAELVVPDIDELPAVADPHAALAAGAPLLYDHWADNRSLRLRVRKGDVEAAFAEAAVVARRRLHSGRLSCTPLETRGVLVEPDRRTGRITVWSSTQIPHPVRSVLADALGLPAHRIRVVAPDVGGGFGCKAIPYPEEILCAHLAVRLGRSVRWHEDRWEHFVSAIHSRDQIHDIELALAADGTILGLRDRFVVDNGAANPLGVVQPYNTIAHLAGCYVVPTMDVEAVAVVTNKVPVSPYRGAGRPEAVFAMDRILDVAARQAGLDPLEVRRRNLVPADAMPYAVGINYRNGTPIVYDSGDFPSCFERAVEILDPTGPRGGALDERGRVVGVGVSTYVEGTGIGPFEGALVRVDETGAVHVAVGACSQGQAHETIFAQIAAEVFDVDVALVEVTAGDTDAVPYGWGTLASRSAVVGGSAVLEASRELVERMRRAVADAWEIAEHDVVIRDGGVEVRGQPSQRMELSAIARGFGPGGALVDEHGPGLEAQHYWEPPTVTFASGAHAVRVAVDLDTAEVEILDYAVVHDCGPLLNPRIVDGQIAGGLAQGIGAALFEEVLYDDAAQPLNPNLVDYLMPSAATVPEASVQHLETTSPLNPLGIKGVGEAGAISPPAAIANAIEDALSSLGVSVDSIPVSPRRLLPALRAARAGNELGGPR